jgi:biotin operon repressor
MLLDAGLTPAEVARRLKCSRTTVWRAEKRFRDLLAEQGIDVDTRVRRYAG